MRRLILLSLWSLTACPEPVSPTPDAAIEDVDAGVDTGIDAGEPDAGPVDAGTKADACAATFGSLFTNTFGRADGTVVAVVPPAWPCPLPNSDHVVIQVRIDGGVQRLVVNVRSDFGDPNIRFRTMSAPLPAPAWSEGWHEAQTLNYVTYDVHSDAGWESLDLTQASNRISDALTLGAPISVYATSSGGTFAASAHKIHRNGFNNDGAIVIDPLGAQPTWLLFSFANQSF